LQHFFNLSLTSGTYNSFLGFTVKAFEGGEFLPLFYDTDRFEGEIEDDDTGVYQGRDNPGLRCTTTMIGFQTIISGVFFASERKRFANF